MAKKNEPKPEEAKPQSRFPEKPVRLTSMGEGVLQFDFKDGPSGSTRKADEIKILKDLNKRLGNGIYSKGITPIKK